MAPISTPSGSQGLLDILAPDDPLPDRQPAALVAVVEHDVIAVDIRGLEGRFLGQILSHNRIDGVDGLGRKPQLPAKDAIRRKSQPQLDILPVDPVRFQEPVDFHQDVSRAGTLR